LSKGSYDRLVQLAKRRLAGIEHGAEDVVSRAVVRWASLPPRTWPVARLEQVIKSEAASWRRTEHRLAARQLRAGRDPTLRTPMLVPYYLDVDLIVLRRILATASEKQGGAMATRDVEILDLLLAGYSQQEIAKLANCSRDTVRRSRTRWQLVLSSMLAEMD
jgi:DNA-directed RNA polymerase specialized sigma24 family protein